jgi:hypothetical protein
MKRQTGDFKMTQPEVQIATPDGIKLTKVEVRHVGRQRRFALTRHEEATAASEFTDWAITHVKTGRAITSLIPQIMPRTIKNLSAVVKDWDKLDGVNWAVIDDLSFGDNANLKTGPNKAAALVFAQKLRQSASETYEALYVRPGRL